MVFAAGETSKTVTINLIDDNLYEDNEILVVDLASGSSTSSEAVSFGSASEKTITITSEDAAPTFYFTDTDGAGTADEEDETQNISVTIAEAGKTVKVDYAVTGTARNGYDFVLADGTLTYTAGVTTQNIALVIKEDVVDEEPQTVILTLSANADGTSQEHATLTNIYTWTITDDDAVPYLSFSELTPTATENSESYTVRVYLDDNAGDGVRDTSEYEIIAHINTNASGSATDSDNKITGAQNELEYWDYTAFSNTAVTIAAGDEYGETTITLKNDAVPEPSQTIYVDLTMSNAYGQVNTGNDNMVLTITDSDSDPTVAWSVTDPQTSAEEVGTVVNATLVLSGPTENGATVYYAVDGNNSTAIGVDDGVDNDGDGQADEPDEEAYADGTDIYDYSLSPIVGAATTFTGGTTYDTQKNIAITINNDALYEDNETMTLTLAGQTQSGASNGTQQTYLLTINNDNTVDPPPKFFFTDEDGEISEAEADGNSSNSTETISVTIDAVAGKTVSVDYALATQDAAPTGASGTGTNADYSFTASTLTFAPGATTGTFSMTVIHDYVDEPDQTVKFSLCLLYTSPSPRDQRGSRMPSSA